MTNSGYYRVVLHNNGTRKRYSVHRLVCLNFKTNNENKDCVNHIDNDRTNNHPDNLEWCTYSENMIHMHSQNRHKRTEEGEANRIRISTAKQSKLTYEQAEEIRKIQNTSQSKIAKEYGVSQFLIYRILNNLSYTKKHEIIE